MFTGATNKTQVHFCRYPERDTEGDGSANIVQGGFQSAPFVTLMMDETTDVSKSEQVIICLCWVDGKLYPHEELY